MFVGHVVIRLVLSVSGPPWEVLPPGNTVDQGLTELKHLWFRFFFLFMSLIGLCFSLFHVREYLDREV